MGYRNARSAGYNRLAMHVGRNAFGVRNPKQTKGAGYGDPAPTNTDGCQPRKPSSPIEFEAIEAVLSLQCH